MKYIYCVYEDSDRNNKVTLFTSKKKAKKFIAEYTPDERISLYIKKLMVF